jgi:isoleucyl-tRNA synthetase
MFNPIEPKESFPNREKKILQFWQEKNVFTKSLDNRKGKPFFSFYDGPPFATGLPHYGHLLVSTIKDIVLRYKTMKGFYVPRRFGWDCHGLPVENEIEKTKNLSGAPAIEQFGIGNFNEECRSIVLRYSKEWQTIIERMGRWVDFSHTYRTMDMSFMESVWWVFGQLFKKGLIYEGFKVMPYSAKLGTPLSNFEAQENYKEVDDPSLTVAFQLLDEDNTFLLVWTTTPWTLVSNLAITVAEEIDYVKIKEKKSGKFYILAKERTGQYFKDDEFEIIAHIEGKKLEGRPYKPLFPHFEKLRIEGAFHVILDGFVTLDEGTGLVHTAPGFGEADFYACQKRNLPLVCPVDANGQFTEEVPEYKGRFVKDCDKDIIRT